MDLRWSADAEAVRADVRKLLDDFLPTDWQGYGALPDGERATWLDAWREKLVATRFIAPGLPLDYGGSGLGAEAQSVVTEEFVRAGVPYLAWRTDGVGFKLLVNTLLAWGTPKQREFFIPKTFSGEIRWAQGYSEPGAGSDLFNVRTRARQDDDGWVVDGQKVWQTAGTEANWCFALVRTDPTAERSKGLSFLLIDLNQPGAEVRPIKNMAGKEELAEIFFTGARASADAVVGGLNNGARVALTLLGFERGDGAVGSAVALELEMERLVALANDKGKAEDPSVRARLVERWTIAQALYGLALRTLSAVSHERLPGPESSIQKLLTSEHRKAVTELAMDILDTDVIVPTGVGAHEPLGAQPLGLDPLSSLAWVEDYLQARPATVYGGSSEIQRNTIGEQILGLPREPRFPRESTTNAKG
ncbi:acyl-CoA dehydrogenase family protein [Mycobacterium syngnathidarum]